MFLFLIFQSYGVVNITGKRLYGQWLTGKRLYGQWLTGKRLYGQWLTGKRLYGQWLTAFEQGGIFIVPHLL
jgi:uncharacterized protein YjbI with pentapeptide repeats